MRPNYPNGWDSWMQEFDKIWKKAVIPKGQFYETKYYPNRVWYVGDKNYYNDLVNKQREAAVLVDRITDNPISATMIRQNPIKHWDKIAAPFRRVFSHNILITGTASEGKSTLVTDLGKYFNAPHSYEWAKEDYIKKSDISEWELDGTDFIAFLYGQYELNKSLINSPANHGIFFADTDSIVTRMYAEYYAKDKDFALTQEEFEKVAVVADELARKSRWDKIFLVAPHGVFVDDHSRYMGHSGMDERKKLFDILCEDIKRTGDWDKVTILSGNYYENFMDIVNYVKEIIENDT
jgi:NadR type nicotinamide-nucleotide adenylyltransferase